MEQEERQASEGLPYAWHATTTPPEEEKTCNLNKGAGDVALERRPESSASA